MKPMRPHRFPLLSQLSSPTAPGHAVGGQLALGDQSSGSVAEGFQQGLDKGYQEGYETGLERGQQDGQAQGRQAGWQQGLSEGRREALAAFEGLATPIDAMLTHLTHLQADFRSALRKEVIDLVAKVARQVIRCELTLQPSQLLALVDETLAAMPPVPDGIEVYLNPEECQRIQELSSARASRWTLIPDPRLELGECRVKAGDREADAGCQQRLSACMDQVRTQLLDGETAVESSPAERAESAAVAPALEALPS